MIKSAYRTVGLSLGGSSVSIREAMAEDASVIARFVRRMVEAMASVGGHPDGDDPQAVVAHSRQVVVGGTIVQQTGDWGTWDAPRREPLTSKPGWAILDLE